MSVNRPTTCQPMLHPPEKQRWRQSRQPTGTMTGRSVSARLGADRTKVFGILVEVGRAQRRRVSALAISHSLRINSRRLWDCDRAMTMAGLRQRAPGITHGGGPGGGRRDDAGAHRGVRRAADRGRSGRCAAQAAAWITAALARLRAASRARSEAATVSWSMAAPLMRMVPSST